MGSDEFRFNELTEKRFSLLFTICRFGAIPLYVRRISKVNTIFNIIITVCSCFTYFGIWLDVIYSGDFKRSMNSMRTVTILSCNMWMDISIRFRKDDFCNLIELTKIFVWEDLPKKDPNTGNLTVAGWIPRINNILMYLMTFITIAHILMSIIRLIYLHELIYTVWYPFDIYSSPQFEIVNIVQVLATFPFTCQFFSFPYIFMYCICIACSQLDKLKENLLHLGKNINISVANRKSSNNEYQTFNNLQDYLNDFIRLHQDIIRFLKDLEDTMSLPLFGIFLFLQVSLCISAFSAVMSWGEIIDMVQGALIYGFGLLFLSVHCSTGSLLTEKAYNHRDIIAITGIFLQYESVKDAAWASDWVGAPISYQRSIIFIIAQANHKFTLTAGKFILVSNATLSNMLNESLSLFMFLLTMKDKNEEIIA